MKTLKTLLLCGSLGLATLLVGCQTGGSDITPTSAVTCSACRIVHYKAPNSMGPGGKSYTALQDSSRMECADCEAVASSYAKGNRVTKHQCKSCGGMVGHSRAH